MTTGPPKPKKIPKEIAVHGHTRTDYYYWMNDRNNPDVIAHLKAENIYTKEILQDTEALQENLFQEITGRIKKEDISAPYYENGYFYYYRYKKGLEYPVHYRKKDAHSAKEEIFLNVPELAEGKSYYHIHNLMVAPDNHKLAFAEDTQGRRLYTIRFKELRNNTFLDESIPGTSGSMVWSNDSQYLFYIRKNPETLREFQVYKHRAGTDPEKDQLIYQEDDEAFILEISKAKTWKYIFINCLSTLSTEVLLLNADDPHKGFKSFLPREANHEYEVVHHIDKFFVRTNWMAQNFRLMEVKDGKTRDKNAWKEVLPARKDTLLEEVDAFENYIICGERKEGLLHIHIIEEKSRKSYYITFDEPVYTACIGYNPEFNIFNLRYEYTSFTTPVSVYYYDMLTGKKKLLKRQEIVGDFNPDDYQSEHIFVPSSDGVIIPVSLVYKKGIQKDGCNPLLQYGYGSYGISEDVTFSAARLSLLDRGFIYAICHIRGGEERGRWWYEDGKFLKKKNTFRDFVDCSRYFIQKGYTNPERLVAMGGSAGGMLMGAVANMAPELYHAIVADVPFVDVLTTMLDESLPLTTEEFDEWGNPKDKTYYDYMLGYSPYDNVSEQEYPHMLVMAGFHDSQVQYWEPVKWVARLRDYKTDYNYLLLYTNLEAGHGGASGRFKKYREIAMQYAFIFKTLNMH